MRDNLLIALQHSATYCNNILQHITTHTSAAQDASQSPIALQHPATPRNTCNTKTCALHERVPIVLHVCLTLQHTAIPCNTLQHSATHHNTHTHLQRKMRANLFNTLHKRNALTSEVCLTLQHPATPCNTLQHPATHTHLQRKVRANLIYTLHKRVALTFESTDLIFQSRLH